MRATYRIQTLPRVLGLAVCLLAGVLAAGAQAVPWKNCLRQRPEWYGSPEAVRIADNVLLHQFESGGWDKNIDLAAPLSAGGKAALGAAKKAAAEDWRKDPSTIDNGATVTELRFLARVCRATRAERFKAAWLKGLDLLLAMQYGNGGWPQCAFLGGYHRHITFNDHAMINVMRLMREVAAGTPETVFVGRARRERAARAVARGLRCILRCQVRKGGRLTAWCAQHDEKTLAPAPARAYEKVSLSGAESVGILEFLMGIERPSPEVIRAVEGAADWLQRVRITGVRLERRRAPALPRGIDQVLVSAPAATPMWARFYEIGSNRPIFCGRDGVIRTRLADIDPERRTGYAWYGDWPARLLAKDYPAWRAKWIKP